MSSGLAQYKILPVLVVLPLISLSFHFLKNDLYLFLLYLLKIGVPSESPIYFDKITKLLSYFNKGRSFNIVLQNLKTPYFISTTITRINIDCELTEFRLFYMEVRSPNTSSLSAGN